MKFKDLTEDWKRVGVCITVAGTIAATAIGAEIHFAKAGTQKELQQQMYSMQLSQNYNNFQMRRDSLVQPYVRYDQQGRPFIDWSRMPKEIVQQVKWLENQIRVLEQQMGLRK